MSTTVKAKVTEVERRGLKVNILKDKGPTSVGFIPRRELSWDESVNATLTIPKVGDEIEARVTHEGKQYIYLSLRQTSQPWKDAEKRYCLDQVVRGEVVGVRNFGVFVQLSQAFTR